MPSSDDFAARVFDATLATMDLFSIHLGDRLGYYRALLHGPATPAELATRTGSDTRYAREWLEQQAVTGILEVELDAGEPEARRYALPAAHAEVLTEDTSQSYLAPLARMLSAAGVQLPALVEAYRTGDGLPWSRYGTDMRESQADINRPPFQQLLGPEYLRLVPDVFQRLSSGASRVADLGCGAGWSSIGIAQAFPQARVRGLDVDGPTVELARRNAIDAGVADRVRFDVVDATDPTLDGDHDLVIALECVHDLADPVGFLMTMGRLASEDGAVIVADMNVGEMFAAPGDAIERLMYGYSILVCLPDCRSHPNSVATGTVMRPETFRRYAAEAGFPDVEILPIDTDFWRFYRLR
ncbi:MAG TPA: methyltransferase domain-containing protein [Actinomycetota bacterium]|nr:methyltransferase domain-containing protein [Actinomycetota bacterium]